MTVSQQQRLPTTVYSWSGEPKELFNSGTFSDYYIKTGLLCQLSNIATESLRP
ncbi:hypothetical protein [Halomicronema sp. CCY15110]|uniref:hypothetical protein n=1 Tax=Halomicronema sp. CCY15110 TaxID=2767773 RepID=UPI00194EC8C3|nr:hypothetical protein [Halomicronema sp. CCY15110]